jgi:hypothetical protein
VSRHACALRTRCCVVYRGERGESLCDVAEILSAKVATQVLHSNRGDRHRLVSSFGHLGAGCSLGIAIVPCQIWYACRYSRDFRAQTTLDPRVLIGPDSETLSANMRGVNTLFLNGFLFFRVNANVLCIPSLCQAEVASNGGDST